MYLIGRQGAVIVTKTEWRREGYDLEPGRHMHIPQEPKFSSEDGPSSLLVLLTTESAEYQDL